MLIKFFSRLALAAALLTAAGPSFSQSEPALAVPAAVAPPPPIAIGLATDDMPFSARNRFGALGGFDVEVARLLCAELEARCRLVALPAAELQAALSDGRVDAVFAAGRIAPNTLASRSVAQLLPAFVVPRSAAGDLEGGLPGRYGAVIGTETLAGLKARFGPPNTILTYASREEMWIDLSLGRLDGVLTMAVAARREFLTTPLGTGFRILREGAGQVDGVSEDRVMIVPEGAASRRATLEAALARVMAGPDYAESLSRHLTGLAAQPNG
ncbi:MAG: transporter substrate-binding domain-containing protein [Pseudomonadota bacterium]